MKPLPSKVIIIGAGPSGLFAARRLKEIAKAQNKEIDIVFIEKENVVGGKCHTYKDPVHPELRTEEGAGAVAPNYGIVIDALKEHQIKFETMIPVADGTVEIKELYASLSFKEKLKFDVAIMHEMRQFNNAYNQYKAAVNNKGDLPEELKLPFSEYCETKGMKYLPIVTKPFVPGFGYGAITHCPTYSVLEYLGKTTIPEILMVDNFTQKPSLLAIHDGFQLLMEKIAAHFDVRLNSEISRVERDAEQVTVHFKQNGKECVETGDTLILATSPKSWPSLGMDMTDVEQQCVNNLEFYRYPVAVYKVKGLPAHQYYFPPALEAQGFGHLALITSRDNRDNPSDGRLCTVYVNLPPGENNFQFDHEAIERELHTIPEVTEVTVVEEKIWEDYMSTLPWELRLALQREQGSTNTQYLGSHALGGFEDVACVANVATSAMNEAYTPTSEIKTSFSTKLGRLNYFFNNHPYSPLKTLDDTTVNDAASSAAQSAVSMQ